MHEVRTITDQLTLVVLDIRIWSGRKKLRPEDLKLGTEVPPADLVSLGSKRICNPKALTVFSRKKKAAERACLIVGTRFLGGFAIARDQTEGRGRHAGHREVGIRRRDRPLSGRV